jgi:hypothetical protein
MENDDAFVEQTLSNALRVSIIALTRTHRRTQEDDAALRSTTLHGTACHFTAWHAAQHYL